MKIYRKETMKISSQYATNLKKDCFENENEALRRFFEKQSQEEN